MVNSEPCNSSHQLRQLHASQRRLSLGRWRGNSLFPTASCILLAGVTWLVVGKVAPHAGLIITDLGMVKMFSRSGPALCGETTGCPEHADKSHTVDHDKVGKHQTVTHQPLLSLPEPRGSCLGLRKSHLLSTCLVAKFSSKGYKSVETKLM